MCTILWQVCDSELFPVSIFEVDSVEHQPIDPQKNNGIEPLQGINITERYTNYCIYQELSSCKYIRLGVIPITLSYFVLPTFCIDRYQNYHGQTEVSWLDLKQWLLWSLPIKHDISIAQFKGNDIYNFGKIRCTSFDSLWYSDIFHVPDREKTFVFFHYWALSYYLFRSFYYNKTFFFVID